MPSPFEGLYSSTMIGYLKASLESRIHSAKLLWMLILCFVTCVSFSIAISHIFLTLTTIVYFYWKLRHDRRFPSVPLLLPVFAFMYCSLLSAVFSIHPSISILAAKDLTLFIIIPIVFDSVRNRNDVKVIYGVLILAGLISAVFALFQAFSADTDLVNSRIRGFMGHWMTFSGLLMILNVLLLSHLLFERRHPFWFYPAFALFSVTLLLSLTRNAWLGFLAASFVLIAMRKIRWVFAIPAVVLIVFLASVLIFPGVLAERIRNIFNPNETSNRDRLQMLYSGWEIIKDYPLTGVGHDMVKYVYPQYRAPDSVFRNSRHLHNNLVQLAAENGIPTLIAWLWLIGKVLHDLIHWKRKVMNPDEEFMIHGTIGVVVSLFVAGMFEYNFGDSEIKMLFFVLITIPYAWHRSLGSQRLTFEQPQLSQEMAQT